MDDSVSELSLVLRDVRGDFQNTTFDLMRPSVVKMSKALSDYIDQLPKDEFYELVNAINRVNQSLNWRNKAIL